jgi:hypothetical protein
MPLTNLARNFVIRHAKTKVPVKGERFVWFSLSTTSTPSVPRYCRRHRYRTPSLFPLSSFPRRLYDVPNMKSSLSSFAAASLLLLLLVVLVSTGSASFLTEPYAQNSRQLDADEHDTGRKVVKAKIGMASAGSFTKSRNSRGDSSRGDSAGRRKLKGDMMMMMMCPPASKAPVASKAPSVAASMGMKMKMVRADRKLKMGMKTCSPTFAPTSAAPS